MEMNGSDILRQNEDFDRLRGELRLQRRVGIKVKLDFDSPQWWTVDFMRSIEKLATQKLRGAAKSCVRSGSVVEMNVEHGLVEARVQGSRKAPYHVRIYTPVPSPEQIDEIKHRLSERAIYGALLLAGEMPEAVRDVFSSCGAPLVPGPTSRTRMVCTCPEPTSICKHILAALFVLTDAFDRDPFLLLRMRGLDKDDILSSITGPRGELRGVSILSSEAPKSDDAPQAPIDDSFFGGEALTAELKTARSAAGDRTASHPPLFDFPLWRGETSFKDSMSPYYENVKKLFR